MTSSASRIIASAPEAGSAPRALTECEPNEKAGSLRQAFRPRCGATEHCSILCLMLFEEAFDEIAGSIKVQLQQIGLLRLLFGAIIAHALLIASFLIR
jgi:hypothetical protein